LTIYKPFIIKLDINEWKDNLRVVKKILKRNFNREYIFALKNKLAICYFPVTKPSQNFLVSGCFSWHAIEPGHLKTKDVFE